MKNRVYEDSESSHNYLNKGNYWKSSCKEPRNLRDLRQSVYRILTYQRMLSKKPISDLLPFEPSRDHTF